MPTTSDKAWWDTNPAKAPKEKPELEAKIEQRFLRQAHKRGWKTRKLNGTGARSWHDQLVVAPGVVCLIEFKRKGGKLSPGQELHHEECRTLGIGHLSLVTDDSDEALKFVMNCIWRAEMAEKSLANNPFVNVYPRNSKKEKRGA